MTDTKSTPLPQATWDRITGMQHLIRKVAAQLARSYDEDTDEIESIMVSGLADKFTLKPSLVSQPDSYLTQVAKNCVHSYYRHKLGGKLQYHYSTLDENESSSEDDLEQWEIAEAVRYVIEHSEKCRELVEAILAERNDDLFRDGRRVARNRPCRNRLNFNVLAQRIGKPKSSLYREVAYLRDELALAVA